jgi:PmbA protein
MLDELLKQAQLALNSALEAGAKDAVAGLGDGYSTSYTYRNGKLEEVKQSASRGLGIQLYVDGRYSSHSTTDLRPQELRRFVRDAVELTRHLEPDPFRVMPDAALYANRANIDLDQVDKKATTLTREQSLAWLRAMDKAARADARVISASSTLGHGYSASARVTSNGFSGVRESTGVGYGANVTLDEPGGRRPEAGRHVGHCHLNAIPEPETIAAEALKRALDRLGSVKGPSARATLVVDREAGSNLVGRLIGAMSAGSIQQKRSFLAGKKDQRVISELFTLTDDPLIPGKQGSRLFDGEGISAKVMPLFDKGVLCNYFIDTYYGRKLGWAPTTGGASNLQFGLGSKNLEQLIADAGSGFYVNSWLGGNCDGTTGDFSLGIRGHVIESGKKGGPIGEMNITGNVLELFSNLIAIGNDPYPYSSYSTPTLVFKDVQFSGQ